MKWLSWVGLLFRNSWNIALRRMWRKERYASVGSIERHWKCLGDSSVSKVFTFQGGQCKLNLQNLCKKCMVACACDPRTETAETGRSLGLTGWLPWPPWQILGKWEILSQRKKNGMVPEAQELKLTSGFYTCTNTHTWKHTTHTHKCLGDFSWLLLWHYWRVGDVWPNCSLIHPTPTYVIPF